MIFAREVSDPLTGLVKKIDEATAQHSDVKMGSFFVFCSDSPGLKQQLEDLARKENLKETILTLDKPAGPPDYGISPQADVTVVLYVNKTVKVNRVFKKGELHDSDVDQILSDLSQILPASK